MKRIGILCQFQSVILEDGKNHHHVYHHMLRLLGEIVSFSFIKLKQEIRWLSGSFGCQHGTGSEKEGYNSMNYILNSVALDDNV